MSWDDLQGRGVDVASSARDSLRFGLHVARGVIRSEESNLSASLERLHESLASIRPDIAVLRWPAQHTGLGEALQRRGWSLLPADTLVYWSLDLRSDGNDAAKQVIAADEPGGVSLKAVGDAVRNIFMSYPTHYTASEDFEPQRVLDGYVDWAVRTARENPGDCYALLHGEGLAALATTTTVDGGRCMEVLLAGTAPARRGKGVYGILLDGLAARAAAAGRGALLISTQASNVSVQRAWARRGFLPIASFTTVHARLR